MSRLFGGTAGSGATDCLYNAILSCHIKFVLHRVAFWPFWNCLPEIKLFGHLAFWPFFTFLGFGLFETAYGQIWPFLFFGPGNLGIASNKTFRYCNKSLNFYYFTVFYETKIKIFKYIFRSWFLDINKNNSIKTSSCHTYATYLTSCSILIIFSKHKFNHNRCK